MAPALALLWSCGGDPPDENFTASATTTGTTTSGTTTVEPMDTSTGSSSSGPADTTDGGTTTTTTEGSESSSTGPSIIDMGCPECTVLADGLESGRGLNVFGDWVYFTDQAAGTVNRVPKGGGDVEELVNLQAEPYDVVASDEHLFWTSFTEGGSVWRANLPSGPPIPLSSDEFPRMLQLVDGYVYWCAFDDVEGRVRRVQGTGIGNAPETLVTVGSGVADLVVQGNEVFFTAHNPPDMPGLAPTGLVYGAPADVPTDVMDLVVIASDQSEPWGVAAGGNTVYWVNGLGSPDDQPKSVVSAPSIGGGPLDVMVADQTAPWGIAADAQYVYWTDYTDVRAVPVGEGDPILLADFQVIARSIVVDDDSVYWITRERVLQRPKP